MKCPSFMPSSGTLGFAGWSAVKTDCLLFNDSLLLVILLVNPVRLAHVRVGNESLAGICFIHLERRRGQGGNPIFFTIAAKRGSV
jgi:hypothetical protein